jgi:hypothetical protein
MTTKPCDITFQDVAIISRELGFTAGQIYDLVLQERENQRRMDAQAAEHEQEQYALEHVASGACDWS